MAILPAGIQLKVQSLIQQGNALKAAAQYREALQPYTEAYQELPQPKEDRDISIHLFNALGYCYFKLQEYGAADYFYNQVLFCEDGFTSAEGWLGIGKSRFELGDTDKAKEALLSAYMLNGKAAFADEDAKYYDFLQANVSLVR